MLLDNPRAATFSSGVGIAVSFEGLLLTACLTRSPWLLTGLRGDVRTCVLTSMDVGFNLETIFIVCFILLCALALPLCVSSTGTLEC
jgi:hypothetical protein